MTTYTTGFKGRMVQRMAGREAISANALAQEVGVSQNTLSRWLRHASEVTPTVAAMKKRHSARKGSRDILCHDILCQARFVGLNTPLSTRLVSPATASVWRETPRGAQTQPRIGDRVRGTSLDARSDSLAGTWTSHPSLNGQSPIVHVTTRRGARTGSHSVSAGVECHEQALRGARYVAALVFGDVAPHVGFADCGA